MPRATWPYAGRQKTICCVFILLEEVGKYFKNKAKIILRSRMQTARDLFWKEKWWVSNKFYVYKRLLWTSALPCFLQPLFWSTYFHGQGCTVLMCGTNTLPVFREVVLASFYKLLSYHLPPHFPALVIPNTHLFLFSKCALTFTPLCFLPSFL